MRLCRHVVMPSMHARDQTLTPDSSRGPPQISQDSSPALFLVFTACSCWPGTSLPVAAASQQMLLGLQCRRPIRLRSQSHLAREPLQQATERWWSRYAGGYYGGGAYYPYYGGGYSGPGYQPCKLLAFPCLHKPSGSYSCQPCMVAMCQQRHQPRIYALQTAMTCRKRTLSQLCMAVA